MTSQNPLSYLNNEPKKQPDFIRADRAPTTNDQQDAGIRWQHVNGSTNPIYESEGAGVWNIGGAAAASETEPGIAQLATTAQAEAGTDDTTIMTPAKVVDHLATDIYPQQVSVTLTAPEVKALATTQIELVAAPGAGKVIKFLGASFKLVYGSEVFAESGDNLGIKYTDDSGVQVSQTIEMTGFIDQSANTYTNAEPTIDAIVAATAAENQALVLDNLNANITGNASDDSTLVVSVFYRTIEI